MNPVDNNQFEVKSAKRKVKTGPNVYLNPALDLLVNEDPMCNTAMEVTPNKRRKRTTSCDIAAFENTALDLGISKAAVNEFLVRELQNVHKNVRPYETPIKPVATNESEPIYANITDIPPLPPRMDPPSGKSLHTYNINNSTCEVDSGISILEQKSSNELENNDLSIINKTMNIQTNVSNQVFINNSANLNLSFIDRLALDSPQTSNQSLYLDDDLNESNIMEIKTITIITKKKILSRKNTNPFLDPNIDFNVEEEVQNPFLAKGPDETVYNAEVTRVQPGNNLLPKRLFANDTNSTISTVNDQEQSVRDSHDYENVEFRSESPIYENIDEITFDEFHYNKQSKILGHDVSKFNAIDIMNLNKISNGNNTSDSTDNKKHLKQQILKVNKLSKKVFKTLKKTFKTEKVESNTTLNPYEVPRKPPKEKSEKKNSGIENPALKLDNSDDIEIEELSSNEDEQYETIKTIRNTRLNENVTPLKERSNDNDLSHNRTNTPGKKVRFDSTLNREKIITGDSFECDIQSPGFDAKIDRYHDELENCINERKFIQQNM
ncbi:unnamed protein product [Leptosia nina]|uniref:Uncharacterized protein n=1 Tax=Leptosia nina TaxID=320188 RepID=A0AAV1IZN6_9NEOP